jgi:hypothetical protein
VTWFAPSAGSAAVSGVSGAIGGLTSVTGMRFPQVVTLSRPEIASNGDVVATSGTQVRAAIWMRRKKSVLTEIGEAMEVVAQGFFPRGTDVQRRDRVELASGQAGGPQLFEVLTVIPGFDDRGVSDHVGVELKHAAEGVG